MFRMREPVAGLRGRGSAVRGGVRGQRARRRLELEPLEGRIVLSSVTTYSTAAQFNLGTYTIDEDFDKGVLFNVNHNAPGADQLQLNAVLTTFPVMWIANSGDPSVSKWDTQANKEVARYFTHFAPAGQAGFNGPYGSHSGPAPSRTAVDRDGNVYIANRHFDNKAVDVIKILASGGIDRNGNGVIDTSADLNGDGNIGDSNFSYDAGEILPLADLNGNGIFEQTEITDERIAWVVQVGPVGGLGRSLAIDRDGNIWVGLYNDESYYKLDGETGQELAGPIATPGHTPYGAQVDGNGILWGASLGNTLLKLDTNTNQVTVYNHGQYGGNYGIAIGNGKVYVANYSGSSYIEFDPATETFSIPADKQFSGYGIAVDKDGNIVVGNSGGGVTKFLASDGSVIWDAPAQPGTGHVRGVVVDSKNDVWAIHLSDNRLSKFAGTDGKALGAFETGNAPYTYTDATGLTRFTSTNPSGRWNVVQDSGLAGTSWGRIFWNSEPQASVPVGTSIVMEARAAETQGGLSSQEFLPISSNVPFNLTGRYIEVRATLNANSNLVSPVLSDVTIGTVDAFQAGNPRFLVTDIVVDEAAGTATVTIERQGGTFGQVSVDYLTAAGTAVPGSDYNDVSGTLVFGSGVDAQSFTVPIVDDAVVDGDKTVQLVLKNFRGTNGEGPGQLSANLLIRDNDRSPSSQPRLLALSRQGYHHQPTELLVTFSERMDVAAALDPVHYQIRGAGRDRRLFTADDQIVPIQSISYSTESPIVRLRPARRLNLHQKYGLVVSGELRGASGVALDGDNNGQPGGDYVTTIHRGIWNQQAARKVRKVVSTPKMGVPPR